MAGEIRAVVGRRAFCLLVWLGEIGRFVLLTCA